MSGIAKKLLSAVGKVPYDLSTFALDPIDSITLVGSTDTHGNTFSSYASNDGTRLILGYGDDYVESFQFSTAYDLSTISAIGKLRYRGINQNTDNLWVSSDGLTAFVGSGGINYEIIMATAWDVTSYSSKTEYRIDTDPPIGPQGVDLNASGTKIFWASASGGGARIVEEHSMSPAYDWGDLFTATKTTYDLSADLNTGNRGIRFSPDGLFMYLGDDATIKQFKLTTAFDVSTASFDFEFDPPDIFTFQDSHFTFIDDGNKLLSVQGGANATADQIIRIFE